MGMLPITITGGGASFATVALSAVHAECRDRIVAPASLIANWAAEAERFAPSLSVFVARPAFTPAELLKSTSTEDLVGIDLVVTSYAALLRLAQDPLASRRRRRGAGDQATPGQVSSPESRGASAASTRTATGRRPTNLTAAQPVAIWTSYSSVEATPSP